MLWWWIFFAFFILAMLALDLGVFNRKSHVIKMKEAMLWTLFWVTLALLFGTGIYFFYGHGKAMEFLAGYLIEYSLSIDNLFVFMLIFRFFNVPRAYEHKALFWGILMALATRAVFIFAGVALINTFSWVMYIFGAFLIFTGIKMALNKQTEVHPDKNIAIKLLRYVIPVTSRFSGARFFVVKRGVRHATPMLAVLLALETTDILFAIDSIPAVLAISKDPFIIYTSNVFAILGLRSLFFAISGLMKLFHLLHYGLAAILTFVGIKMLIEDFFHVPVTISLLVIASILVMSIVSSLIWPDPKNEEGEVPPVTMKE
ncbi:MAG: Inner membrane protein alx [Deltaproteobacteria bacterium ADurb.Bin151]|jgi:tellurite resistance protein TerC|nr:TerC family protein [Smithella sp.]OQB55569.1 MAG: Inner membrane protein alx [Deltaproteobacteria bacterium ADurb.Bin151]HNZ10169.1 TerC family protein [Smithellaceae bacterium]HOG82266.1 TerC family protein [Smithellaceae bacterium]HOQ42666.1 TerC family protein [Smithellaceae bacterium]